MMYPFNALPAMIQRIVQRKPSKQRIIEPILWNNTVNAQFVISVDKPMKNRFFSD